VDVVPTGAKAIESFDQRGHRIVICDLMLPDIDGLEITRHILEITRHIKDSRPGTEVIMITGYGSVAKAIAHR